MMKNIEVDYKSRLRRPDLFEKAIERVSLIPAAIPAAVCDGRALTSAEALANITADVPVCRESHLVHLDQHATTMRLLHHIVEMYPGAFVSPSGNFLYPAEGGFMGWHTNSDVPCKRVYITFTAEQNKSFFRYRVGDEIITSWDTDPVMVREFDISSSDPLWHCVYSETNRWSYGFRVRAA